MTMKSTIFCDLKFTEVSKELTAFIFRVAKWCGHFPEELFALTVFEEVDKKTSDREAAMLLKVIKFVFLITKK
jgi:hypothetical protein